MANKCDMFFVKIKPEYIDYQFDGKFEDIPERHHEMFAKLWNHFQNLPDIISSHNHRAVMTILDEMVPDSRDVDINITDLMFQFYGLYRNTTCLQHFIRNKYFDTVLIIQNLISYRRFNIIKVLEEDESIELQVLDKTGSPVLNVDDGGNIGCPIDTSAYNLITEEQWCSEDPEELVYLREQIYVDSEPGTVIPNIDF